MLQSFIFGLPDFHRKGQKTRFFVLYDFLLKKAVESEFDRRNPAGKFEQKKFSWRKWKNNLMDNFWAFQSIRMPIQITETGISCAEYF